MGFLNDFETILYKAVEIVEKRMPVRTGSLKKSIKLRKINDHKYEIYQDQKDINPVTGRSVDYLEYVNEPWTGRRGHIKNPRTGVFDEAVEDAVKLIAIELMNLKIGLVIGE